MALRLYFSLWLLSDCLTYSSSLSPLMSYHARLTIWHWRTPHRRKRNPRPGLDTHRRAAVERVPDQGRVFEGSFKSEIPMSPMATLRKKLTNTETKTTSRRGKWRHEAMQHCNISLSQPFLSALRSGRLIQDSKAL